MYYSKPVQLAINHIRENLTTDISLESLADHAHFSPYHFHKLFFICTGETPMEYIRRLRLRSASRDLSMTESDIIGIALKYGFGSQDGFCRAFKRYYGITPGEYRRLNFGLGPGSRKKFEEVNAIMYDISIYEKLACSSDNKKDAINTLDRLLQLSEKARNSGLLSLEAEIDKVRPEFFKKSIQMLIDGIDPESLKDILLNYALCGGYTGKELLVRILIIEGILGIQQGVPTNMIREKLSSFFGEDFINEINTYFGLDSETQYKKIEAFILKNENQPARPKEASLLEQPLNRMDGRSLQRLLREIDAYTLALAIAGSSGKTQARVLKNVSKKLAVIVINEIESMDAHTVTDIASYQKKVLEIMNRLGNQDEIVI